MCDSIDIGKSAKKSQQMRHDAIHSDYILTQLQLIVAISEIPQFLASFLYPVIAMSTNKDEPSHIYFMEDALELWLVVIQNSTSLTPELLELSRNLLPIIGKNSIKLKKKTKKKRIVA